MPDLNDPLPDLGHEALRQSLVAALAAGDSNTSGVSDAYFLTDILLDLLAQLQAQVDALTPPT